MKRDLRLHMYEKELRRLVLELEDHDYVIFEDSQPTTVESTFSRSGYILTFYAMPGSRDDSRYVQYLVHNAAIYGEVGSRHGLPESEGLRKESVTALGCLGFEGGASRGNFSRDHLPHDARRLACLTELLFGAAYGETADMMPLVRTRASREAESPRPAIEFDA